MERFYLICALAARMIHFGRLYFFKLELELKAKYEYAVIDYCQAYILGQHNKRLEFSWQ